MSDITITLNALELAIIRGALVDYRNRQLRLLHEARDGEEPSAAKEADALTRANAAECQELMARLDQAAS